ncbi:hypothetical protein L2U69_16710 [Zavarzinia compransoris]|uniref:sialidase family protein n=1 Tax=Zavarzinia marina TaxID=2911065 RepID=UPI001F41622F|nr:hypothetical protein [Zavarzinia marina]MCF4167292.1 hypothetical protein [Zavarzinia marina]
MRPFFFRLALAAGAAGCVSAAALAAPAGFEILHQGTAHEALFCMASDGDDLIAVGAPGLLFESADGGATWAAGTDVTPDGALLGCRLKRGLGLVVGQRGAIFRKDGAGWTRIPPVTDARLFAVDMNAAGLAVAVGAFGTLLVSDDAGKSWSPVTYDWSSTNGEGFQPHVYGVSVAGDGTITIVAEFEAILQSTDGGRRWTVVHKGNASLFDVAIGDDGIGYAVGQDGRVLRTRDGGTTWDPVASGIKANLLGVSRGAAGSVLVTGLRSMLVGSDAADRFTSVTPGDVATGWYQAVVSIDAKRWLAAGNAGRVVRLAAGADR